MLHIMLFQQKVALEFKKCLKTLQIEFIRLKKVNLQQTKEFVEILDSNCKRNQNNKRKEKKKVAADFLLSMFVTPSVC